MIRCPDLHWPAVAGSLLMVLTVAGCVPANADPVDHTSSISTAPLPTTAAKAPESASHSDPATSSPSTTSLPRPSSTATTTPPAAKPKPSQTIRPGTAVTTLATLTVKGRAPKTGYDRDLFGQAWADVDRNGCDTRNDILRRDLDRLHAQGRHPRLPRPQGHPGRPLHRHHDQLRPRAAARRTPSRSTTSSPSPTPGRRAPSSWSHDHAHRVRQRPAQPAGGRRPDQRCARATVTPPPGCRRARRSAAPTSPGRSRSSTGTSCGSPPPSGTPWCGCSRRARRRCCPRPARSPSAAGAVSAAPTPSATSTPQAHLEAALDPRFDTCREANAAGYGPYSTASDPEYDWYQDRDHDGLVCER